MMNARKLMTRTLTSMVAIAATVTLIPLAVQADEKAALAEIQTAIQAGNLEDGAKKLTAARAEYPTSLSFESAAYDLARNYATKRDYKTGQTLLEESTSHMLGLIETMKAQPNGYLLRNLTLLNSLASLNDSTDSAIALLAQADEATDKESLVGKQISELRIMGLARFGKLAEAKALLEPQIASARKANEADGDDAQARLQLAKALLNLAQVEQLASESPESTYAEVFTLLADDWIRSQLANTEAVSQYLNANMRFISSSARSQPAQAQERMAAVEAFIKFVNEADDDVKKPILPMLAGAERSLPRYQATITAALKHVNLIGQPAMDISAESWANGSPLTADDLKGKVVLVDFWAVWCGPCIATFPHLREWRQTYHDRGLEIVGVTRYYNYTWDKENNKATRAQQGVEVPKTEEREMLEAFADEFELEHPFAVMDSTELNEFYGVTGIPQAVLIDRQGKVRMIRVGSGDKNAHDLHEMIETLLDETP